MNALPRNTSRFLAELWPSLVLESLSKTRCLVRYLATPEQPTTSAPVMVYEEVEASSLVKFPGGLSLMALKERLQPLEAGAEKAKRDAHIRDEFLLADNDNRQVSFDFACGG